MLLKHGGCRLARITPLGMQLANKRAEMVEAEERRIQARKEAAAAKQHEGEAQKKESKAAEPAQ